MGNRPILFADDNVTMRELVALNLESSLNTKVVQVGDGQALVEEAKKADYGLIITDINMPQKDGIEAIREIRSFNPEVPILVFSASNEREAALQAGANKFFDVGSYMESIDKVCKGLYQP